MNINKKITGGILVVLMIFGFCQGLVMHTIISSTGEKEIEALYNDEMGKAKQKLKNYVEIAYNIVESNFENSQNKEWLQKEYGLELNKIIDIAESLVVEHIQMVAEGSLSIEEAQQRVLYSISQLRYNEDTGYVWINDIGKSFSKILTESNTQASIDEMASDRGMGYVWVNDISKPYPKMLMHPTIPQLNGKILNDIRFNCALGTKKNLFVAMVEVVEKDGEGFVDYVWPKPTKEGLTEDQPKLSYVRAIPEWNWVIGTGIYVDDALDKAIDKSEQDLKKMRYNGGEGYFWINDRGVPFPKMVMHPTMPQLDGKVMDDDKFNVARGEPKHLFRAIIKVTENDGEGFVDYMWPKPTKEGLSKDQPKLSFLRAFEPFGWIIGTGIYIDSIDLLIEEKTNTIKSTNSSLLLTILSVAIVLFLFLTTASYYLVDRFFIRKINEANDDLQLEIEERKKTEKELIIARKNSEIANSAKSEFLANMSHEIRTPMNAVIGLAHLLLQTDLTGQQQDYLNKITLSADNLLNIIDDILDFSKIEAGKLELEAIPFHLRFDVLQNASQVVGLIAADKGLEMMLDLDSDLPDSLIGDPVRLRQILINLMNNAVKFTEKGDITLSVHILDLRDEHIWIRFEVSDSGIGLTDEQLNGLFTAFSQADASTTRKFGGTGLGLTISKTLAEMMGGEIGATSVYGKGSTFWFTAGFRLDPETDYLDQPVFDDDIKDLKVLVVDNNETARIILTRHLEQFGYRVSDAESGEEAIHLLQSARPGTSFDLVLLDWMMPGMDGIETARHIQSGIGLETIPAIIMLTAYDKQKMIDKAKDVDLKAILVKPVFPSSLFDAILTTFGKSAAKDEQYDSEKLSEYVLGARILLVEDNVINQQVAREILEQAGVVVTIAEDGEKGIEKLRVEYQNGNPFDVVLMDIQMPVMDGYEATREIRKLPELKELPIVAMTANALVGDRQKALDAGMNDHVTKPVNVKELFKVLGEWVRVPEERQGKMVSVSQRDTSSVEVQVGNIVELPEIPGLDLETGLRRSVGNRSLYENLLKQVLSNYSSELNTIRKALEEEDYILAERLAHTMKGVAGNIGAEPLYQASSALEDALRVPKPDDIASCLPAFEGELRRIIEGLQKAYPDNSDLEKSDSTWEPSLKVEALVPVFTKLREYLADYDPEAVDFFLAEKDHLAEGIPAATLAEMEKTLRNFEFEAVLAALDQLMTTEEVE